jgi:hypothetical protein
MVIPAMHCSAPDEIDPDDLVLVNFDRRKIACDGLYLLERVEPAGVVWCGCRRFQMPFMRGMVLKMREGSGWVDVPDLAALGLRVAGYVERIYMRRPAGVPRHGGAA